MADFTVRRLCAFLKTTTKNIFMSLVYSSNYNFVYESAANLDCNFFTDNSFYKDFVLYLQWLKDFLINNSVKYAFIKRTAKTICFFHLFLTLLLGHPYSFISQQRSSFYDSKFELGCRRQGRSTLKTAESSSVNLYIQLSLSEESIF